MLVPYPTPPKRFAQATSTSQAKYPPWGLIITILAAAVATICLIILYILWRFRKLNFMPLSFRKEPRNMNAYRTEASANPYAPETELIPSRDPERLSQLRSNTGRFSYFDRPPRRHKGSPVTPPPPPWGLLALDKLNGLSRMERVYEGKQIHHHTAPSQYGSGGHAPGEVIHDVENPRSSEGSRSTPYSTHSSHPSFYATPLNRSNIMGSNRTAFNMVYGQPQSLTRPWEGELSRGQAYPFTSSEETSSMVTVRRCDTAPRAYAPTAIHISRHPSWSAPPTVGNLTRSATTRSSGNSYREGSIHGYGVTPVQHEKSRTELGDGGFEDVDLGSDKSPPIRGGQ